MQRRTFMQSLATAFATPAIGLAFRPSKPTIRWDLFTDEIACRYDLSAPWVVGDSTFATDGRALISAKGCDGETGENRRIPSLHGLPWDDFDGTGWKSSRELIRVATAEREMKCPECYGFGVIGQRTKCSCDESTVFIEVDGKTVFNRADWLIEQLEDDPDFFESDPICRKCRNSGYAGTHCARCKGDGYVKDDIYRWQLDGKTFCPGLLARFQTLGDFDCLVTHQLTYDRTESPLMLIRFNGGVGMLMGMKRT